MVLSGISGILDLKESSIRIAPYYAIFAFMAIIFTKGFSGIIFLFLIASVIVGVSTMFSREQNENIEVAEFLLDNKQDMEKARKVANQSRRGFLLRAVHSIITFSFFVLSFVWLIVEFVKTNGENITILIFVVLGSVIFLYSVFFTIKNIKKITHTKKILLKSISS